MPAQLNRDSTQRRGFLYPQRSRQVNGDASSWSVLALHRTRTGDHSTLPTNTRRRRLRGTGMYCLLDTELETCNTCLPTHPCDVSCWFKYEPPVRLVEQPATVLSHFSLLNLPAVPQSRPAPASPSDPQPPRLTRSVPRAHPFRSAPPVWQSSSRPIAR